MACVAVVKHVLRFAAGDDPGPRSGVWRIFTYNDEIYVLPRYAGGELKTSLHSSGAFRHAFTEAAAPRFVGDENRAFKEWREPRGEAGNLRLLLEVVMPTDELTAPTEELTPAEKRKIELLDPAPPGAATIVSLFLLPPGEDVDSDGKRVTYGPMVLMENWRLPNRGSVLIFRSHQPLDARFASGIAAARSDIASQVHESLPAEEGHQRLMLLAHDDEKHVAMYLDLAATGLRAFRPTKRPTSGVSANEAPDGEDLMNEKTPR